MEILDTLSRIVAQYEGLKKLKSNTQNSLNYVESMDFDCVKFVKDRDTLLLFDDDEMCELLRDVLRKKYNDELVDIESQILKLAQSCPQSLPPTAIEPRQNKP